MRLKAVSCWRVWRRAISPGGYWTRPEPVGGYAFARLQARSADLLPDCRKKKDREYDFPDFYNLFGCL